MSRTRFLVALSSAAVALAAFGSASPASSQATLVTTPAPAGSVVEPSGSTPIGGSVPPIVIQNPGSEPRFTFRVNAEKGKVEVYTQRQEMTMSTAGATVAYTTERDITYTVADANDQQVTVDLLFGDLKVVEGTAVPGMDATDPAGKGMRVVFNRNGSILDLTEAPGITPVPGLGTPMMDQLKSSLSAALPTEPIGAGGVFTQAVTLNLGPIVLKMEMTSTMTEVTDAGAKADVTGTVTMDGGAGGMAMTVENGTLKGTTEWRADGLVGMADLTSEMTLVVDQGGQKISQQIKQRSVTTRKS